MGLLIFFVCVKSVFPPNERDERSRETSDRERSGRADVDGEDGFLYTAPVDAFGPQNEHGLHNMIGLYSCCTTTSLVAKIGI